MRPLSAPWILRTSDHAGEVCLLVRDAREGGAGNSPRDALVLDWRETGPPGGERTALPLILATALDPTTHVARFRIEPWGSAGAQYRIRCSEAATPWLVLPPDPQPGTPWRYLLLADHQLKPGVRPTLRAILRSARRPYQGVLFAGDLVDIPDNPTSWCGRDDGLSFFDGLAAAAGELFADPADGPFEALRSTEVPLLSTTPIVACAGNHEVTSEDGDTPRERFRRVAPGRWNTRTFQALFVPSGNPRAGPERGARTETEAEMAGQAPWFTARIGPLEILSLFVARCWERGDHQTRTGPCYELPGRFIFESIEPGSRQLRWVKRQIGAGALLDSDRARESAYPVPAALRVALMHHPPFAQGHNALPLFGEPVAYRENLIARHLVPVLAPWADLVFSGHNHAVNHHCVDGVHYLESSHMSCGYPPARRLADGGPAPEPLGNPSRFFLSEEGYTFFATLEVTCGKSGDRTAECRARVRIYRVHPGGAMEEEYGFALQGGR